MTKSKEKYYLAVPLGVLRRFIEENKNDPDTYLQLFELVPEHIYPESAFTQNNAKLKSKSTIIISGDNFPPHRKEPNAN